jgi:hypothetical protein
MDLGADKNPKYTCCGCSLWLNYTALYNIPINETVARYNSMGQGS